MCAGGNAHSSHPMEQQDQQRQLSVLHDVRSECSNYLHVYLFRLFVYLFISMRVHKRMVNSGVLGLYCLLSPCVLLLCPRRLVRTGTDLVPCVETRAPELLDLMRLVFRANHTERSRAFTP